MNFIYKVFVFAFAVAAPVAARAAHVRCVSAGELSKDFTVEGELDVGAQTFRFTQLRSPQRESVLCSPVADVDPRCGIPALPLEDTFTFDVTEYDVLGDYLLQLPREAVAAMPVSFAANLHQCDYDGNWSSFQDVSLHCDLQ